MPFFTRLRSRFFAAPGMIRRVTVLNSLPPEYRPYLRRVAILIVLAAVLGVVLALAIPAGHHH